MPRLHSSLLLLAIVALATSGAPAGAGNAETPVPGLEAELCAETPATAPAAIELAGPPIDDFILCTCTLCEAEPETICQISPMGYSIRCKDWAETHC